MFRDQLRYFRHWTKKVAEFTANRSPQSDDAFLTDCEISAEPIETRCALAVRKVFGEEGSVEPTYIYATDRYPEDLGILPSWDSIDWLDLIFRLERELDVKVPRVSLPTRFTVRSFVHALILEVCKRDAAS